MKSHLLDDVKTFFFNRFFAYQGAGQLSHKIIFFQNDFNSSLFCLFFFGHWVDSHKSSKILGEGYELPMRLFPCWK